MNVFPNFFLFGEVEGVDDLGVEVFHLPVRLANLGVVGDEVDVVEQVVVDRK